NVLSNGFTASGGGLGNGDPDFSFPGGTVSIQNSTISGNHSNCPFCVGGGIGNIGGTVSIRNSTVSDNSAIYGGGIHNAVFVPTPSLDARVSIQNSTVSDNLADFGGGGIVNGGMLTVQNSTVSDNVADQFDGGGITNGGTLTIRNSIVSDNDAGRSV